jgi:3-deoxy-manno-octulosonate cytidylyltransferase (CMP-KDO synthetase)
MSPIIVIPARMASKRLPGKPLADICGEPMIVHVWRRAMEAGVGSVVVAAAEAEIVEAIRAVGGEAIMTDADLPSGSDRVNQALSRIDPDGGHDVVINLQGDLPTLDPNVVKAVVSWDESGRLGHALYFSRATVPAGEGPLWHHVGLYVYRRAALERFVGLAVSPLERRERLEQLRALEAGMKIAVARVDSIPLGVDTPADLERARALLAS